MSENSRDDADHDLFRSALQRLYREELDELGGESCRNILHQILAGRWETLAAQAVRRAQRAMPVHDDALLAFDSLKHFLLGEIKPLDLTLPELVRVLKRLPLRHWIWVILTISTFMVTVVTVSYALGQAWSK